MAKLTRTVTSKVATLIRRGWSTQNLCNRVGISANSYHKWLKIGIEILEEHNNEKQKTIDDLENNETLSDVKRNLMVQQVTFAFEITQALGEQKGLVEEAAYVGALDNGKDAVNWLERRDADTWAKRTAPPVVVEMHQIEQIIIRPPELTEKEEPLMIEAEYEDA